MNDHEAPGMMRAAVLNEYVGGAGLVVQDVPRPVPEAGEVLIGVAAAPINPSDLAFLEGNYSPRPSLPTRAGLEGETHDRRLEARATEVIAETGWRMDGEPPTPGRWPRPGGRPVGRSWCWAVWNVVVT